MQKIYFSVICLLFASQIFSQTGKAVKKIEQIFAQQQEAWNRGDTQAFMQDYWQSDSLMYIGVKGISYGWQNTLNSYKKSYPTKEAMGKLTFKNLYYKRISKKYFFVVGKWHLERQQGNLQGHYSLIFKKIKSQWKIIADHSS